MKSIIHLGSIFTVVSILEAKLLEFFHRINEYIEYACCDVLTSFVVQFMQAYNFASKKLYGIVPCWFLCECYRC